VSLESIDERLRAIAEVADALRPLVDLAAQAPALVALAGDSFDDVVRRAMADGIDVERGIVNGAGAALRFGAMMDAEKVREMEALLQSGVLAPSVLKIIGGMGQALLDTVAAQPKPVGMVGLVKAFANPDIQRGLGFLITFAERFGAQLGAPAKWRR
jgi:hypothetical protein